VNSFAIDSAGKVLTATNTGIFKQAQDQFGLLAMSRLRIEFTETNQGSQSMETVIVSNAGNAPLTIKSVATSGYESSEFNVSMPLINRTLQPNDTVHVHIAFQPKGTGKRQTDLQFTLENNFSSSDHIVLEGLGAGTSSVGENDKQQRVRMNAQSIIADVHGAKLMGAYSLLGESIEKNQQLIEPNVYQWNELIPGLYVIMIQSNGNITPYPIIVY
jgi:hypothetical protein